MATRLELRNDVKDKLLGVEDSSYGDFEWTDLELDTYLDLSVARLFPAVYQRVSLTAQVPVSYGTNTGLGYVTVAMSERVFLVENELDLSVVRGWEIRPNRILGLATGDTYTLWYFDGYTLPSGDAGAINVSTVYVPLIVLGAVVEALESRHDTGVRPDPTTGYQQTSLLDRLQRRWDELKSELGMSLPAVSN